ncbi:hypothetical protein [Nocardioides sp. 616]|uniref:hypothetical protein n=1 Tax=Nocardioides sp. 616 TaxID=2268090 RepID=UPI0013B3603B|nr:hypothetical protein [Nocardioides sp. 616]
MAGRGNFRDMVGYRTQNARVVTRSGNTGGGATRWVLECDCGKTFEAAGSDIRRRPNMTCRKGHQDRMMLRQTFGGLIVTGLDTENDGNVFVDCTCGRTGVSVRAQGVRYGMRRSCGCLNREQASAMGASTNKGKTGALHPSYGIKKEVHHNWKGDTVSYSGAHSRLKRWQGAAKKYPCFNCGNQAKDWAFSNACPDARVQMGGDGDGMAFCTHAECYEPACRNCHSAIIDSNNLMVISIGDYKMLAPRAA